MDGALSENQVEVQGKISIYKVTNVPKIIVEIIVEIILEIIVEINVEINVVFIYFNSGRTTPITVHDVTTAIENLAGFTCIIRNLRQIEIFAKYFPTSFLYFNSTLRHFLQIKLCHHAVPDAYTSLWSTLTSQSVNTPLSNTLLDYISCTLPGRWHSKTKEYTHSKRILGKLGKNAARTSQAMRFVPEMPNVFHNGSVNSRKLSQLPRLLANLGEKRALIDEV